MMGMKRTKASSSEAALADVVEQAKVVEEAAKVVEDAIEAVDAPKADAKAAERQAVLDRLADKIIAASAAHGGVPVFLKDIQCK